MRATAVKQLGHEIDAVLTVARPEADEDGGPDRQLRTAR